MPDDQSPLDSVDRDLSQADAIAILQQSIQQLDGVLQQLNRSTAPTLPKETLENLINTTTDLANSLSISPEEGQDWEAASNPSELDLPDIAPRGLDQVLPELDRLESWWDRVLGGLRRILPRAIAEKISDWALTSILASIIVITLVSTVLLLPRTPSELAELPPIVSPAVPSPVPEPSPEIATNPPELIAPEAPEPIPFEPPIKPKFTPEQSLIASIQQEISGLTENYASGLIQSIEADFLASRLKVVLAADWYGLSLERQGHVGKDIWLRSQKLEFRKLEIIDDRGRLVARSPVIGDQIILFQTHPNDKL